MLNFLLIKTIENSVYYINLSQVVKIEDKKPRENYFKLYLTSSTIPIKFKEISKDNSYNFQEISNLGDLFK